MRKTQFKGDVAVARAVSTFTEMGFDILLPLTESSPYDIVVDTKKGLKRVQVKYSSERHVDLRRIHSNSNGFVVKKSKRDSYDWLYILSHEDKEFLIKKCLHGRRSITPQDKDLIKKDSLKNVFEK